MRDTGMNNEKSEMRIINNRIRRRRQLRRNISIFCACTAVIIFTAMFAAMNMRADAGQAGGPSVKYYHSVVVHPGESLLTISEDNFDPAFYVSISAYLDEVMYINHFDDSTSLHAGDCVIVPYYR